MIYGTNRNQHKTLQDIIDRWEDSALNLYSTPKLISDDALDHAAAEMGMHSNHDGRPDLFAWHARHVLEAWRRDAI